MSDFLVSKPSDYIHYHEMQVDDIKKSKDDDGKNLSAAYLNWCKLRNDSSDSTKGGANA